MCFWPQWDKLCHYFLPNSSFINRIFFLFLHQGKDFSNPFWMKTELTINIESMTSMSQNNILNCQKRLCDFDNPEMNSGQEPSTMRQWLPSSRRLSLGAGVERRQRHHVWANASLHATAQLMRPSFAAESALLERLCAQWSLLDSAIAHQTGIHAVSRPLTWVESVVGAVWRRTWCASPGPQCPEPSREECGCGSGAGKARDGLEIPLSERGHRRQEPHDGRRVLGARWLLVQPEKNRPQALHLRDCRRGAPGQHRCPEPRTGHMACWWESHDFSPGHPPGVGFQGESAS